MIHCKYYNERQMVIGTRTQHFHLVYLTTGKQMTTADFAIAHYVPCAPAQYPTIALVW